MQYKQTGNTKSVIFFELITVRLQKKIVFITTLMPFSFQYAG